MMMASREHAWLCVLISNNNSTHIHNFVQLIISSSMVKVSFDPPATTPNSVESSNFFMRILCMFSANSAEVIESNCDSDKNCARVSSHNTIPTESDTSDESVASDDETLGLTFSQRFRRGSMPQELDETGSKTESIPKNIDLSCTESEKAIQTRRSNKKKKRKGAPVRRNQAKLEEFVMIMSAGVQIETLRRDLSISRVMLFVDRENLLWNYCGSAKKFIIKLSEIDAFEEGLPNQALERMNLTLSERSFFIQRKDNQKSLIFITPTKFEKRNLLDGFKILMNTFCRN